jgi:hypothetical protein
MSSLPKSVVDRLSHRARAILLESPTNNEEFSIDKKVFAALENLHTRGQLRLTAEQVLDISIIYPVIAQKLITPPVTPRESLIKAIPTLTSIFSETSKNLSREDIHALRIHGTCLESFLSVITPAPPDIDIGQFVKSYAALGNAAKILGGGKWDLEDKDPEPWKIDLVKAKLRILGILSILLSSSAVSMDQFIAISYSMIDENNPSTPASTPLVDSALIDDYENAFHLTATLLERSRGGGDDPRVDHIVQIVQSSPLARNMSPGGLKFLLPSKVTTGPSKIPTESKGKGRAPTHEPVSPRLLKALA